MLDEYKEIAAKLVVLKSVSADFSCKQDCEKTAEFLKELLISYGFDAKTIDGYGNPIIYSSYIVDPSFETCLLYGHYDVQPAAKEDGWNSDPFTLFEMEERFYGRGIMDDKCQFLIHILAIGKLIKEKKLSYNVKFLFEGEEELGSPHIEQFVKDNTELLSCDFILISDGEKVQGKPTIELSNRGVLNCTLTMRTALQENHSGIYSQAAPNAIHELSKVIAKLYDENNRVAIDGFYDDVEPVDTENILPFDKEQYKENTGTKAILTEPEYDFYTQTGLRPSLTITGITGGYIGQAHKTTIPPFAIAKLSFRLVKNQQKEKLIHAIQNFLKKVVPDYVSFEFVIDEFAPPNRTNKDNVYVQKAIEVLEKIFGENVLYRYVGGTEPVVAYFEKYLGKPLVSIPFSDEDAHMHSANENFKIQDIEKGFLFSEKFFGEKN